MQARRATVSIFLATLAILAIVLCVRSFTRTRTVEPPRVEDSASPEEAPRAEVAQLPAKTQPTPPVSPPVESAIGSTTDSTENLHVVRVESDGRAVVGARINVSMLRTKAFGRRPTSSVLESDANGVATFRLPAERVAVLLEAWHPDYATAIVNVDENASETRIEMERRYGYRMRFIDEESGSPFVRLSVRVNGKSVPEADDEGEIEFRIDEEQRDRARQFAEAGEPRLPFAMETVDPDLVPHVVRAGDVDRDIPAIVRVRQRVSLEVRVEDARGTPVDNALVFLGEPGQPLGRLKYQSSLPFHAIPDRDHESTNADGKATFGGMAPQSVFDVRVTHDDGRVGSALNVMIGFESPHSVTVTLDDDRTGLHVDVVDAEGVPIERATVTLLKSEGGIVDAMRHGEVPHLARRRISDEDGTTYRYLLPGRYRISVEHGGLHHASTEVDVHGPGVEQVTIALESFVVEGSVLGPSGSPLGGVPVSFETDDGKVRHEDVRTDDAGQFVLTGLPRSPGRLDVGRARASSFLVPRSAESEEPSGAPRSFGARGTKQRFLPTFFDDIMPGNGPVEVILETVGSIRVTLDGRSGQKIKVEVRALEADEKWSATWFTVPDLPLDIPVPFYGVPVSLVCRTDESVWTVAPLTVYPGETRDLGNLRPD